jgi:hypothetical protein
MNRIFVQIASFRDPQLSLTLESMLKNAKFPENLVIGICNQYNNEDSFDINQYREDKRFKIIDVLDIESKGVCWARNKVQQLYNEEEYTLQIDSHMRFEKDWDETLINMILDLQTDGYKKPLLTGYVSSFDPDNDPNGRVNEPWRMVFDRFIPEGAVFFLPEVIPNWKEMSKPIPARFYSAHFCFTLGQFTKEVQHNPEYLFHPHRVIIWHEYTRKNRIKQWDIDKSWGTKNNLSHKLNRQLFGMDGEEMKDFGIYGFGKERTLRDYEKYAGINFKLRGVQQYTVDKRYPPNPIIHNEEDWLNSFTSIFRHCIDVHKNQVPETDYDFWVVAFHNEKDETMFRKDAEANEIKMMMNDPDGYCKIWREFNTTIKPKYWVVWPHSLSKGWCERIVGNL